MDSGGIYRVEFHVATKDVKEARASLVGKPYPGKRGPLYDGIVPPDDSWLCVGVTAMSCKGLPGFSPKASIIVATYSK